MGNRTKEVNFEILRELTQEDLDAPLALAPVKPKPLTAIRASHHQLAQVLARGASDTEASLVTGYTPGYISILRTDPAFQELLAHYGKVTEAVFVDVAERMRVLGLGSLEELQRRLEEAPDDWSRRELMELSKLMLVDSRGGAASGASGGAPGVQVAISFVAPDMTRTVEGTAGEIKTLRSDDGSSGKGLS